LANGLKHFNQDEIIIDKNQAQRVLKFFFGNNVPAPSDLTNEDVAFAQGLLLEAIDKSYAMSYVQAIFDCFYMKIPDDISGLVKEFAKKAARIWFDHAAGKDFSKPKIYVSVRNLIANNFSTVWQIRMQGGDLTY